jgi:hypothetical protein
MSVFSWVNSTAAYHAYSGAIGAITTDPAGDADDLQGGGWFGSTAAYTPGDYYLGLTCNASLDQWVVSGNEIRCLTARCNKFYWQTQFSATVGGAAIPKDASEVMDFSWRVSWDRH